MRRRKKSSKLKIKKDKTNSKPNKKIILLAAVLIILVAVFTLRLQNPTGRVPTVPTTPPIAEYKFEGSGSLILDESSNNLDGLKFGDAERVAGEGVDGGKALHLDGTGDWITVSDDDSLDLTDAATFSVWINPASVTQNGRIIDKQTPGVNTHAGYILDLHGGRPRVIFGNVAVESGNALPIADKWYHLVATFDKDLPSNQIKLYQDGVLIKARTRTAAMKANALSFYIGAHATYGGIQFNGLIDELKIYDYALSTEEVEYLFNELIPPDDCGNGNLDAGEECDGGDDCTDCVCDAGYQSTDPISVDCELGAALVYEMTEMAGIDFHKWTVTDTGNIMYYYASSDTETEPVLTYMGYAVTVGIGGSDFWKIDTTDNYLFSERGT